MAGYPTQTPYWEPVSAMEADELDRYVEARPRASATVYPTPQPPLPPPPPPPPPAIADQVKRKPVGSRRSRPTIHTAPNPFRNEHKTPSSAQSRYTSFETPSTSPQAGARITVPEPPPKSYGFPGGHQKGRVPNLHHSEFRSAPQYVFRDYDDGEDVREDEMEVIYNNESSTTINSTRPLAPSPLSIVKTARSITQQPKSMSRLGEIALVVTVCLAHFLTQAGLAQSIAPLPLIASSFTSTRHTASPPWYSAAYSLTVGTFILPSGRFGDLYGHKRLFLIGWLWFAISSLLAGLNPRLRVTTDLNGGGDGGEVFFCFCRALQGVGPALLMPNGLAILGRTYDDGNRKNMAFALFGASAPVGFVIGSVMSSLLAQKADWCWAYWALAIACIAIAIVSVFVIPSLPGILASAGANKDSVAPRADDGAIEKKTPLWKQLDIPGTLLAITSLILINFAINQAALVSWTTPYTYFLLLLGLVILSIFFFIEFTPSLTSDPLIPRDLLSLDTSFVLACIACGWATFGIWIFYLWEFLERLRNLSPLLASAQFSPAAISGLLAAVSTGILLSKTTPQVTMLLSMCAFFVGVTLIATVPVDQIYWAQAFVSIVVMPWGMDMSFPSATILLSSKVSKEKQGVAMSLVNTVVNYSISVGLGLAGTVQSQADGDGSRLLDGYRGAWHFGMGLSGVGMAIAVTFLALGAWKAGQSKGRTRREKEKAVGGDV